MVIGLSDTQYFKSDNAITQGDNPAWYGTGVPNISRTRQIVERSPFVLALMAQKLQNAKASSKDWELRNSKDDIKTFLKENSPSQALFERLVNDEPGILLKIVKDGDLEPSFLTYATEALGHVEAQNLRSQARDVLLSLMEHSSSLVREGAVYGLSNFLDEPNVEQILRYKLSYDASTGVRAAIEDIL